MKQSRSVILNKLVGILAGILLSGSLAMAQANSAVQADYASQCKNHLTKTVTNLPSIETAVDTKVVLTEGTGSLKILGGENGGIIVYGSNENHIIIVACKSAAARDDSSARQLLSQLVLRVHNGEVSTAGPEPSTGSNWAVNLIVFLPTKMDLKLQTGNGGIDLVQLQGKIEARSENGGIFFRGSGGDIDLRSENGGIDISLQGLAWQGKGLNAHSDNGGLTIRIPADYQSGISAETASNQLDCKAPLCGQSQKTSDSQRETLRTAGSATAVKVSTANSPLEILAARSNP
jgi:hypothetical protein